MIIATLKMRGGYGDEVTIDTLTEEFDTVAELEHFISYNRAAIIEMKMKGKIVGKG